MNQDLYEPTDAEIDEAMRGYGDCLSAICPHCGADAEYPDCATCGKMLDDPVEAQDGLMVSGWGKFHTNEADPTNPAKRLRPYQAIGVAGIRALVDSPQQVDKSHAQWLIPSTLARRSKDAQEAHGAYLALWSDHDAHTPMDHAQMVIERAVGSADYEIYSSRSATPVKQKSRALIPLRNPLCFSDWATCQAILNDKLRSAGIDPDTANEGASQLLYLPNQGAFYETRSRRKGQFFNPFGLWATEIEAKRCEIINQNAELENGRKAAAERREALQLSDSPDAIGAFNRAFSVQDILLQAGYAQRGNTFRHPQSESGSYSASVKNGRVHSLSPNDPLYSNGAGARDTFDAFQVLFCGDDRNEALTTAGDKWLMIGGESWNVVKRREWAKEKAQQAPSVDLSGILKQAPMSTDDDAAVSDSASAEPTPGLEQHLVSFSSLDDAFAPLPHVVDMWIPCDEVTLLAGHGGGGKSYVALMIAVHVALGLEFCELTTTQTNVLFFSGEDGTRVLRQRLAKICRAMKIHPAQLDGKLFLLDASDIDPALFRETKYFHAGKTFSQFETVLLGELATLVQTLGAGLVVVDNASDAFDDDEIKRARVRAFIRALRTRLARPGRAVLLLAHINKLSASAGSKGGAEDYSGSTGWHNSVRSRLSLTPDETGLIIVHAKANLGTKAEPVRLEWNDGVPMPAGSSVDVGKEAVRAILLATEKARDGADKDALVAIIQDFDGRGELITTAAQGPFTAFGLLKKLPTFPKNVDSHRLMVLLRELESSGRVFRREVRTPSRKWKEVFTCAAAAESAPIPDCDPVQGGGDGQS
jgi:hypothetical protein